MSSVTVAHARLFHELHRGALLHLANAWDAGSARLIEAQGAKAVATTSAGVAWAHGYADGNHLPVAVLAATVAEITRAIRVPLSVDMEGGYSADPVQVGINVGDIVGAGAVGINLEDAMGDPALLCAKIEQAKRAAGRLGVGLFVNARIDVYLRNTVAPERRLEEALARAARYREAGADGIFLPGLVDAADIRTAASAVALPLNVMARPGLPPAAELTALGARRLSAGSGIPEVVYGRVAAMASAFLRDGVSAAVTEGAMPYRDINALMAPR
jgi:2-methylisocitrate lyase-like PEP mutase family enzyme